MNIDIAAVGDNVVTLSPQGLSLEVMSLNLAGLLQLVMSATQVQIAIEAVQSIAAAMNEVQ